MAIFYEKSQKSSCNWGQTSGNDTIRLHLESLSCLGCTPVIYNLTLIASSSATLIDHVYTNDLQNNVKCYILSYDLSDHMPVLFTTNHKALIASPLRPQVRYTKNFIAEDFLINLQQHFIAKQINFSQSKDIDQQFTAFTDIFQNAPNTHAPFRRLTRKEVKKKNMDYTCFFKINKNQK